MLQPMENSLECVEGNGSIFEKIDIHYLYLTYHIDFFLIRFTLSKARLANGYCDMEMQCGKYIERMIRELRINEDGNMNMWMNWK